MKDIVTTNHFCFRVTMKTSGSNEKQQTMSSSGEITRKTVTRYMQTYNVPSRSTPFYFTQCSGCGVIILTNREILHALQCRLCAETHTTHQMHRADLESVLASIHRA